MISPSTMKREDVLSDLLYRIRGSKLDRLLSGVGIRDGVVDTIELVEYQANHGVVTVTVDGNEIGFETDTLKEYRSLRHLAQTEKPILLDFLNNLRPTDVVFDVGAHLGLYAKTATAAEVESVVTFELLPANAERLRETMPPEVTVVNKGVTAESGERAIKDGDQGAGEVIASLSTDSGSEQIPVTSLDTFAQEHDIHPTVMKIDVEGAESEVISGGKETLSKCRVVYIEIHDEYSDISDSLTALGFNMEAIHERESQVFIKAFR